jgi:hypothetical protein
MKSRFELAEVIRRFGAAFIEKYRPNLYQQNVLNAIQNCRTAVLGGHVEHCTHCGHEYISYNSCRNRHCPKCQNTNRELWIRQIADLLPAGNYFHVVFTLPESLHPLLMAFRNDMQNILFKSAWETIELFAANPAFLGAQTGMIAVLHTWGQTMTLHPHLHCIVPDSGLDYSSRWKKGGKVNNDSTFLFPVKQMSVVFRGKFLSAISAMLKQKHARKAPTIKETAFNVYAKKPFCGLKGVIEYLGRYTHKIAISNYRIEDMDDVGVLFRYKDYREQGKEKKMYLTGEEFLRRFCLHIQDKGFRRIRYFGIFAASNRKLLNQIHVSLGENKVSVRIKKSYREAAIEIWNYDPTLCPVCKIGRMEVISMIVARPPPGKKNSLKTIPD